MKKNKPKIRMCVECHKIKTINARDRCYSCYNYFMKGHSYEYYLRYLYKGIMRRVRGGGRPNYKGLEVCSRKEFVNKFIDDVKFLRMHDWWAATGRPRSQTPSIDRIDNRKGYTLDNIQIITYGENSRKDKEVPVKLYTKEGKFVGQYRSIKEAAQENNLSYGNLHGTLTGRYAHTSGYYIRYINYCHRGDKEGLVEKE